MQKEVVLCPYVFDLLIIFIAIENSSPAENDILYFYTVLIRHLASVYHQPEGENGLRRLIVTLSVAEVSLFEGHFLEQLKIKFVSVKKNGNI